MDGNIKIPANRNCWYARIMSISSDFLLVKL